MSYVIKPFADLLAMSKEALDTALIPVRARSTRAKAEVLLAANAEKRIALERKITELCAEKEPDFERIADAIDEFELLERRSGLIEKVVTGLFPPEAKTPRKRS